MNTVPQAGSKDVPAGIVEIRVTFSKTMTDQSWSELIGKPRYKADQRICVLKVKLKQHKTYRYWLNSEKFQCFQDQQGRSAVPYLLALKTKGT